jgi:hypothetical protein
VALARYGCGVASRIQNDLDEIHHTSPAARFKFNRASIIVLTRTVQKTQSTYGWIYSAYLGVRNLYQ